MKKSLSDSLLRSVATPTFGRIEIADVRCPGLEFRVTPRGVRSWSFRYRDPRGGRILRATLGKYPSLGLADARQRAAALRQDVAHGLDPMEAKRRQRETALGTSFEYLAERYLNEHSRRLKRSTAADERNLRLHVLPRWGKRPFIEIQRRDVISLIESLIASGKPTLANRVHALASSIFSFAVDADLMPANPCSRLRRRGVEKRGERVLSDPEIRLFWGRAIRPPISVQNGLILRLLLLTGARPGEVAGLRWDEIEHLDDPATTAWVIPAERSKTGRALYVPLSLLARSTILEAQDIRRDPTWVFSSPKAEGAIRPNALERRIGTWNRSVLLEAQV